jgi:hypothetical protein
MRILYTVLITILCLKVSNNVVAEESNWHAFKGWLLDETYKNDPSFKHNRLEVESGVVHVLYNKIGNNQNSGALFNTASIDNPVNFYARFSYYFNLDKKNSFKLMVAPLSISGSGDLDGSFEYGGQNFTAGRAGYAYKFNSYRATYRRTLFENNQFTFRLGITFKIRDAATSLSQGGSYYQETNVGFVPLGHLNFEYRPVQKLAFVLESDLAAAPQGRAIDVALSSRYDINDYFDIAVGYRFLEGGAINKAVYNMAFINYYFLAFGVKI